MKKVIYLVLIVASFSACNNSDLKKIDNDAISKNEKMHNQNKEELKKIAQKFYNQLSDPNNAKVNDLSKVYMADDWVSTPQPAGGTGRVGFVKTLKMYGEMIPDLDWDVKEMFVDGNKVIVRSVASGTPNSPDGHFFGVTTNGSRKFEIMTIDIHTVENGKILKSFHVEDWATAIQQVSAKS